MNSHPLDFWQPFHKIDWDGHIYEVFSRIVTEDDFVSRMRFMLVFPDGKKRMLALASSEAAAENYEAQFGEGSHKEVIRQMVADEAMKEIKAAAKAVSLPKVSPNVKLVSLDMEPPIVAGVDFAKVESDLMAVMFTPTPLPSDTVYGTPAIASPSVMKAQKSLSTMQQAFKDLAAKYAMKPINPAYFGKGQIVLDSLAGVSKEEVFKVLYGETPTPKPQVTPKGLATLEKYGVALAG